MSAVPLVGWLTDGQENDPTAFLLRGAEATPRVYDLQERFARGGVPRRSRSIAGRGYGGRVISSSAAPATKPATKAAPARHDRIQPRQSPARGSEEGIGMKMTDHRVDYPGLERRSSHKFGRSAATRKPGFEPRREQWRRHGDFFGLPVEEMSPKAQVVTALAVLAPVALSGLLLVAFVPALWWIFTTYGWVAFPAFGLLARGIVRSSIDGEVPVAITGERELLEALRRQGELTPVLAAMETSLTVEKANRMLKEELAEGGHLEVRVRGGGLFYALWENAERAGVPGREPEKIPGGVTEEREGGTR